MKFFLGAFIVYLLSGCGEEDGVPPNINLEQSALLTTTVQEHELSLLVPLYKYPTDITLEWKKLIDYKKVYTDINIMVIVNPSNGDFTETSSSYVAVLQQLRDANITTVGYVHTLHGTRDREYVKANILAWSELYKEFGVSGIFFDEVLEDNNTYEYYEDLTLFTKSKGFETIVFNPGTNPEEEVAFSQLATMIVNIEMRYETLLGKDLNSSSRELNCSKAMLIYDVDATVLENGLQIAYENSYQYVYFTPRSEDIWSALSPYIALRSPYFSSNFRSILDSTKLNISSDNWTISTQYGAIGEYVNRYFYLDENEFLHFAMDTNASTQSYFSMLTFEDVWTIPTREPKILSLTLQIDTGSDNNISIMEIYCEDSNTSIFSIDVYNDTLWARLTDNNNSNAESLGAVANSFSNIKLSVDVNLVTVERDDILVYQREISDWNYENNHYRIGIKENTIGSSEVIIQRVSLEN